MTFNQANFAKKSGASGDDYVNDDLFPEEYKTRVSEKTTGEKAEEVGED